MYTLTSLHPDMVDGCDLQTLRTEELPAVPGGRGLVWAQTATVAAGDHVTVT